MSRGIGDRHMTDGDIRLSYKFQRLREQLRRSILDGSLGGKLPGERELARRFRANAKTINKALSDLAADGLLVRHVGRGTFVASEGPVAARPTASAKRVIWLMNGHQLEAAQPDLAEAQQAAARCGFELVVRPFDIRSGDMLPDGALRPREMRELCGVVVYGVMPPHSLLTDLLRRHVGFVLVNVADGSVRTNCVVPDWAQGAFEVCEHLVGLGHRNIQLVLGAAEATHHSAAENGYRTSMRRHGLTPAAPLRLGTSIPPFIMPPADKRPSALLCIGASVAEAVCAGAQQAGIDIPKEISVVAVAGSDNAFAKAGKLTSYDVDGFKIVAWTFELLEKYAPGQKAQMILVPGRVVDRGSSGPPAQPAALSRPGDAVL